MKGLKKVTAVVLLATVMCIGPAVVLGGPAESPGFPVPTPVHSVSSDANVGAQDEVESVGFIEIAIIFMATLLM
jgi:hypothetical protein